MQFKNQQLLKDKAYINGQWVEAIDQRTFKVTNPFDGSTIAHLPDIGANDLEKVVHAAEVAFKTWRAYTADDRSSALKRWYELILEHKEDLALLLTYEQGKSIHESRGEIDYGASFVSWFAEEAVRTYGDVIPGHGADKRIITIKQPIGVVLAITPWNFPVAMVTRKIAPAIAAGCTVILKPAEATPLCALALAYLSEKAGIPQGVVNVITTDQPAIVAKTLMSDARIKKVSFTGSTAVGKLLLQQSAQTLKKVSLELGGNAPFIVFEDADIDDAVAGAIASKYRNSGQTCVCANRIFVQSSIFDKFMEKFSLAVSKLKQGNGLDENTDIGPLINEAAIQKIERLLKNAKDRGATIYKGGNRNDVTNLFFEPTILTNVDPQMAIHQEEIFGPVAPVYSFSNEDEVLDMANNTAYGLAAYFYGNDVNRIWRVAEALDYGMVGINTGMLSTAKAPFGGIKESGIGKEGSKYGIEEYLILKYLCFGNVK